RDLLGAFREGRAPEGNPDLAREELARLAAAKAIRLPAIAGEPELRALVGQLFETRSPLTNPAGRPTYIELHHGELARRFQK
ncbi:MAG: mismatch repair protein MutL, partial [Verrucomicrobia bacterium]|nr:mismatch repair protein MutL [Verrucomicrobiota bacterium]